MSSDDFFPDAVKVGLLGGTVVIPDTGVEISLAPGPLEEAGIEVVFEETWPLGEFSDWINLANSIKSSGAERGVRRDGFARRGGCLARGVRHRRLPAQVHLHVAGRAVGAARPRSEQTCSTV